MSEKDVNSLDNRQSKGSEDGEMCIPSSPDLKSRKSLIRYPLIGSCRLTLAILGFLGFVNLYAQRVNMSVAMVCMVNNSGLVQQNTPIYLNLSTTLPPMTMDRCEKLAEQTDSTQTSSHEGEFNWSKVIQGNILAAFFYGYMVTQVPGGWLAHQFGGKRVFGWSMFLCSVFTLLMPLGARLHYGVLIALRVLAGLTQGVVWPTMHCIWAHWSPPLERSILIGGTFAGAQIGNVIALSASGLLCAYGFDGGWPSIFYIFGILGILWFILWMCLVSDTPAKHPRISNGEKTYIESSLFGQISSQKKSIPWMAFATSKPFWAIAVTHVCALWGSYFFLTNIPTYMAEILHFDVKANGLISALPYIGFWSAITLSVTIADLLRAKGILTTTGVRKLFNSIGQFAPAVFLIILANISCEQTVLAVILLTIGVSLTGCMSGAGYVVNHADIAPAFAGLLFGITNTFGTIPGFVAPIVVGKMTSNKLRSEWQLVFYLSSIIFVFGGAVYLWLGSGEIQSWAKDETKNDEDNEITEQLKKFQKDRRSLSIEVKKERENEVC